MLTHNSWGTDTVKFTKQGKLWVYSLTPQTISYLHVEVRACACMREWGACVRSKVFVLCWWVSELYPRISEHSRCTCDSSWNLLECSGNSLGSGKKLPILYVYVCVCVRVLERARERNRPQWRSVTPPRSDIWSCLIYRRRLSVWWLFNATDTDTYTLTNMHMCMHTHKHIHTIHVRTPLCEQIHTHRPHASVNMYTTLIQYDSICDQ